MTSTANSTSTFVDKSGLFWTFNLYKLMYIPIATLLISYYRTLIVLNHSLSQSKQVYALAFGNKKIWYSLVCVTKNGLFRNRKPLGPLSTHIHMYIHTTCTQYVHVRATHVLTVYTCICSTCTWYVHVRETCTRTNIQVDSDS